MKKILLLSVLFPLLMQAQAQTLPKPQYLVVLSEYKVYVKSPLTGILFEATTGQNVQGAPTGIVDGSANIHHAAFVGPDGAVYVIGDNPSNISATGSKLATLPFTKTPVSNAKSVVAYDNNGTVGYGEFVVTNDGKVILMGSSQSGFRGDGTEGNAAEPAPYTVPLPKPIKKVVAGTYAFALSTDSLTVYRWGGTQASGGAYWAQYSSGAGVSNPDLTHIGSMTFGEPIVDIIGGGDWSYAIGKSGMWYGWAYDTHFLGFANTPSQLKPFALTNLKFPAPVSKAAVGPEATYSLLTNGDLYAWGNNTQAAIGNGQEATYVQQTKNADWGITSRSLMQLTPVKVNPPGVAFVNTATSIGDAFYIYAEDAKGNLWNWGRNKGYVLWNGQGGSSTQQAATANAWDVLAPEQINAFGPIVVTPPPPPANKIPVAVLTGPASLTLPSDTIQLDASKSSDSDGTIASIYITQVAGPEAVLVRNSAKATAYATAAGLYTFAATVTDNQGAISSVNWVVNVKPYPACPACPPPPVPRTVTGITVTINGIDYVVPKGWIKNATYSDGVTQ